MDGPTLADERQRGPDRKRDDIQRSNRQLLNSSQIVVDTYTTDAFGNSVASTGSATNPYQWNAGGKYYSDYESGLQKVGARYYEPSTGRWITQDSTLVAGSPADSQAVNRYLYCGANPIAVSDSDGHSVPPWLVIGLEVLGGAAGVILIVEVALAVWHIVEARRAAEESAARAQHGHQPIYINQQQADNQQGPAYGEPQQRPATLPLGGRPTREWIRQQMRSKL